MRDPRSGIERFCMQHPNFGIPNLMRYICIGNGAVWILSLMFPALPGYMMFSPAHIMAGQIWRLASFIICPPSWGYLAIFAIYFYYMIGNTLEQYWGTPQFSLYFLSGIVLTVVYGFLMYLILGYNFTLSADYVYLSMFFSFAVMFPDMEILLFFFLPVKIKYLAYVDAALFLVSVFTAPTLPAKLLPIVAVLNFLVFCGGELVYRMKRKRSSYRTSSNTVNFRREAAKIRRSQANKLYNHKCDVCGRTDTDHPELEFRYCSRCVGYHCFCSDHINSHIHFTE